MSRLGLIAGYGRLPLVFAQSAKRNGTELIAVAIREETSPELEKFVDKMYWISIGEVLKLIDIFKSEKVSRAVMTGKIHKKIIFDKDLKIDSAAAKLLKAVVDKRDDTLLAAFALRMRLSGITVMPSVLYMNEYLPSRGVLTRRAPTEREWADINFGKKIAKCIGGADIGQSVVVKDKAILAVEAIEGTDETIKRGGSLGNGNAVVVKMAKPRQDMRFDVPLVGLDTLRSMAEAKASCLAMEARKTLFIDQKECVALADSNDIAIVVV